MSARNIWIPVVIASTFIVVCLLMILIDIVVARQKRKLVQQRHQSEDDDDTVAEGDDYDTFSAIEKITVNLGCEEEEDATCRSTSTST
jgi:hypothetical protein